MNFFIDNAFGTDILPLQFILITIGIHLAALITANGTALIHDPRTDILRIVTDFYGFQTVAAMEYPAFFRCKELKKVIFPDTLKVIEEEAFRFTGLEE